VKRIAADTGAWMFRLAAEQAAVVFSARPATVRKLSTFCPARGPSAMR
jgi:hypothetical protein